MNTKMPVGIDDFKTAREEYYLVDKTDFIRRLIDDHSSVMLFTRPRRFGKTLNMSMLDYFFSVEKKEHTQHLFQGMDIEKAGARYMEEQGKYPVIFMTLKDCAELTWEDTYEQFQIFMRREFQKHYYLLDGDTLRPEEKQAFRQVLEGNASEGIYKCSLGDLTAYLHRYYGIKPIVLLDEYDAPLQAAYTQDFYEQAIAFMRRWLSIALKGNIHLNFAVLTGVQRIAKESIFSGLNNLDVYSVLNDTYSNAFGFTVNEVKEMAQQIGCKEKLNEIKKWYDGYHFGNHEIYNPWSVIKYFSSHCKAAPYWINTSDNSILQLLLRHVTSFQLTALKDLLTGKPIIAGLNENVVYHSLDLDKTSLYTILITAGYLTVHTVIDSVDSLYSLRIPNEEIKRVYRLEVLNTLVKGMNRNGFEDLFLYLLSGQTENFASQLQMVLRQFVSSFDVAQKESFYHGFILGMTALFLNKEYIVESNRESGYGRFDVAISPRNPQKAGVIMEFKVAPSENMLTMKAEEALRQIETKEYVAAFQKKGIQIIWKYGIAFCGKHVRIQGNMTE